MSDNKNSDHDLRRTAAGNEHTERTVLNVKMRSAENTDEVSERDVTGEKHIEPDDKKVKKEKSSFETLADDVAGTVSSRSTSSDPDDIAGVADLDRGLKRR